MSKRNSNNNGSSGSSNNNGMPRPVSLFSSFLLGMTTSSDLEAAAKDTTTPAPANDDMLPSPLSLMASSLPPSLLADPFSSNTSVASGESNAAGPTLRPRRLWNIGDKLKPIPVYYPPLDPNCTALVTDVSASLVAVRISECLRQRSIAAEYDEESVTAKCMTVDRVHFFVQLYRGGGGNSLATSSPDMAVLSSLSPPVIVECQRQSGSVTSFHAACTAILQAAKGNDNGADERRSHSTNSLEFQSLSPAVKRRKLVHASQSSSRHRASTVSRPSMVAEAAFEGARELLQKDRLECQILGMERLVNLTTQDISGQDVCHYVSQRLLQDDWLIDSFLMHPEAEHAMATARSSTMNLSKLAKNSHNKRERNYTENETTALIRSFLESSTAVNPAPRRVPIEDRNPNVASSSPVEDLSPEERSHEARLRSLALRVLCNCLYTLSETGDLYNLLVTDKGSNEQLSCSPRLKCGNNNSDEDDRSVLTSRLIQPSFLLSLVQDMQGASRPPSVSEIGYQLTSVHEAALAIRCLRLLAGSDCDDAQQKTTAPPLSHQGIVREFLQNEVVLESLDLARSCGRATHSVLQKEAERTYTQLTEDVRSC
ncbi:MAG: hypothetical protein SGILL_006298 [Bacillariaceae sp.]